MSNEYKFLHDLKDFLVNLKRMTMYVIYLYIQPHAIVLSVSDDDLYVILYTNFKKINIDARMFAVNYAIMATFYLNIPAQTCMYSQGRRSFL